MNNLHPIEAAAHSYLEMGLVPLPCKRSDKKPYIAWKCYQEETKPTHDDITKWWKEWPQANVAVLTGHGTLGVDLDGEGAEALLNKAGIFLPDNAPRVRTGRGFHVYLSTPRDVSNRGAMLHTNGGKPQVDIRGAGGYLMAPPSVHETNVRYMWSVPLVFPLPPAPKELLDLIDRTPSTGGVEAAQRPVVRGWLAESWRGVQEGQRDNTCTRLAGYLLRRGLEPVEVFAMLVDWGVRCNPPLPENDVRRIVSSISKREADSGRVHQPISDAPLPKAEESDEAEISSMRDAIAELRAELADGKRPCIPSPFPGLNDMLIGGFKPAQLIYLAARPSIGKSALAIEFARAASYVGKRVMLVSLESKATQVALRGISQEGKHNASDLARGHVTESVVHTMTQLSERPVFVTKSGGLPVILGQIEKLWPVDFLIVDYLQLLRAPREIRERRLQVEWLSRTLKQIAVEREIPVLCLSAVTRSSQDGTDKAPTLGSLRESGELEHDADIVFILHRPQKDSTLTTCTVAKNRDGKTGVVELIFRPEFVSFQELATDEAEPSSTLGGWR